MTRCPPTEDDLSEPEYVYAMEGSHSQTINNQTSPEETDEKLRLMWLEDGCTDDRVFFTEGDHAGESVADAGYVGGFNHDVECRIPQDQWDDVWAAIADDIREDGPKNPNSFVTETIDWIRFELNDLISQSMHWWLEVDEPFDSSGAFGISGEMRVSLVNNTTFIVGVVAVISLLFVAGRMALQRDAQPARDMVRAILTLVVVSAVGFGFIQLLVQASDRFSRYFIVQALPAPEEPNPDIPAYCDVMVAGIEAMPEKYEHMNFFLFLVCATFILIGSIIMFMYMVGRVFALTLLAGLMPLAAAGTATEFGKAWFDQNIRFIMAFILIKPAGTVVFVVAIRLAAGTDGESAAQQLAAGGFLLMGSVLLPAMLVLTFPFVAPASGGGGAGKALAVAPVAVGAKVVQSGVSKLRR